LGDSGALPTAPAGASDPLPGAICSRAEARYSGVRSQVKPRLSASAIVSVPRNTRRRRRFVCSVADGWKLGRTRSSTLAMPEAQEYRTRRAGQSTLRRRSASAHASSHSASLVGAGVKQVTDAREPARASGGGASGLVTCSGGYRYRSALTSAPLWPGSNHHRTVRLGPATSQPTRLPDSSRRTR
jgi:hypothetical protein